MSKWHIILSLAIYQKRQVNWGLRYKFQFMVKHEYWWPCLILGVGLADEGFWTSDTWPDRKTKPFPLNSQYSDIQRHQKKTRHHPNPHLTVFTSTTWRSAFASLASRHAQQTTTTTKNTLCIAVMLKSWPQSTGRKWKIWFLQFFFLSLNREKHNWWVNKQQCYVFNSLPAVEQIVRWLSLVQCCVTLKNAMLNSEPSELNRWCQRERLYINTVSLYLRSFMQSYLI